MPEYKQAAWSFLSDLPLTAAELDRTERTLTLKGCDCALKSKFQNAVPNIVQPHNDFLPKNDDCRSLFGKTHVSYLREYFWM